MQVTRLSPDEMEINGNETSEKTAEIKRMHSADETIHFTAEIRNEDTNDTPPINVTNLTQNEFANLQIETPEDDERSKCCETETCKRSVLYSMYK